MYTIYYDGGEPLSGVEQNCDLFVTRGNVRREDFGEVLRNVRIVGEPTAEGEPNLACESGLMRCEYFRDAGEYREFVLREYPEAEYKYEELAGKLEYVAMMAGVEL